MSVSAGDSEGGRGLKDDRVTNGLPALKNNVFTTEKMRVAITKTCTELKEVICSSSGACYEMGSLIQEAKFGSVHLATVLMASSTEPTEEIDSSEFERTNKLVAIKKYNKRRVLHPKGGDSAENPVKEMQVMQFLSSIFGNENHILAAIECGVDREHLYMVMPFCSGGDLITAIESQVKMGDKPYFSAARAKRCFRHLMQAVSFLHDLGFAHHDISLENILHDEASAAYLLTDFGMCLQMEQDNATGVFQPVVQEHCCGKRQYMPPEVWQKVEVFDPRPGDLWSAGVALFMLLMGRPPMDSAQRSDSFYLRISAGQLMDTLSKAELERCAADSQLAEGLQLVKMLLKPNPNDRLMASEVLKATWLQKEDNNDPLPNAAAA